MYTFSKKVFYPVFAVLIVLNIWISIFDIYESPYLRIGYFIFNSIFLVFVLSFLTGLVSEVKNFGFFIGIKKSILKSIALMICLFLFGNLNSFSTKNRIHLDLKNETSYAISEVTLSYSFGVTKLDHSLAPNKSKTLSIYPSTVRSKEDEKHEIHLKYFCNNKWMGKQISIGVDKWNILHKGWKINIQSENSIQLKEI